MTTRAVPGELLVSTYRKISKYSDRKNAVIILNFEQVSLP